MSDPAQPFLIDERLGGGLRYTEAQATSRFGEQIRKCCLWREGEGEPVSSLLLFPLRQRIGAAAVATEGFGGVATPAAQRRKGYAGRLLERSLAHLRERVDVAFLYGIEDFYDRFGFATCLAEQSLSLWVRRTGALEGAPPSRLLPASAELLPRILELYNEAHRERSWTIARDRRRWNRIPRPETWSPASGIYLLAGSDANGRASAEAARSPEAYAILRDASFGQPRRRLFVEEMCARDLASARRLLAAVGRRALEEQVDTVEVEEPADSAVGMAAREIGCKVTARTQHSGGGMGVILDRARLLDCLEGELERRLRAGAAGTKKRNLPSQPEGSGGGIAAEAFGKLRSGKLVADDGALLRLLVGYWSVGDLAVRGEKIPPRYRTLFEYWFPGAGPRGLPLPFSHLLDRY